MTSGLPNVTSGGKYAHLSELMAMGLVIFGDSNVDMIDGALAHLMLKFANDIVDEVNMHPYREGMDQIARYISIEDKRPIDDHIMMDGLAAAYAKHQRSDKAIVLMSDYYKTMNRKLWQERNGNTPIDVRAFDVAKTNPNNGSLSSEGE